MIWLAIVLQAAMPAAGPGSAATPERFSILAPQPCAPQDDKSPVRKTQGDRADIIVCGDGKSSQRLPLPDEIDPPAGRGANRDLSTTKVFALQAPPCAARLEGCTVGFAPPIVPIATALVKAARSAFAKKPDKRGRVAIDLGTP
jgi:hypothetical protein